VKTGLNFATVEQRKPAAKPAASPDIAGIRVLVVDDDPIARSVVHKYLLEAGALADVAADGAIALEKLLAAPEGTFDAVLMDIEMPNIDGLELARQVRSHPQFKAMPIIALTAHAVIVECQYCLDAGMDDHIIKPCSSADVVATLARWTKHSGQPPSAVPGAAAALRASAVLDAEKALERMNGNRDLYFRVAGRFLDRYRAFDLAAIIDRRGIEAAKVSLHSLKGLAEMLGAEYLHQLAAKIEENAPAGTAETDSLVQAFSRELTEVIAAVRGYMGNPNPAARGPRPNR
jgi:CheY-like chemotaxis protein